MCYPAEFLLNNEQTNEVLSFTTVRNIIPKIIKLARFQKDKPIKYKNTCRLPYSKIAVDIIETGVNYFICIFE